MSFGKIENPILVISKSLDANDFILNKKNNLGKFNPKSDVGDFVGYSNTSKAYRVYNKRTLAVEESMHITLMSLTLLVWRKLLLMIKRIDKKKKQIWSNKKVFLKHSPMSRGMFLLIPKI